jgi:serine/threonine-protein kinase
VKVCPTCQKEYPNDTRFCQNDGTTLRQTGADLIGSVIADRYHITKKLGEGGMGAVYLGEHVRMGRMSAIKVISQAMSQDPEAIARFNREAANAARISHPNVCAIYDFGETPEGVIYLAMEYIQGEALTDLLEREGALSLDRSARILRQVADALQVAHDIGIVHRDLKPDNIMITRGRDGSDVVKVVDFGIAKAMGSDSDQKVTKTGLVVGTPEYMSPEQLSGDQLDGRSDVYSLGLVLFRMMTGRLPFQAETAQEVMIKRLTDDPMRLADADASRNFPTPLQRALDRALARMPAERYQRAAVFGDDVVTAVTGATAIPRQGPGVEGATQVIGSRPPQGSDTSQLPSTRVSEPALPTVTAQPAAGHAPQHRETKPFPVLRVAGIVAALAVGGVGTYIAVQGVGGDPVTNGTADSTRLNDIARGNDTMFADADSNLVVPANQSGGGDTSGEGGGERTDTDPPDTSEERPPQPERVDGLLITRDARAITLPSGAAADKLLSVFIVVDEELTSSQPSRRTLTAVRDTAMAYYRVQSLPDSTRAEAAYIVAMAYRGIESFDDAWSWIQQADRLRPNYGAYRTLMTVIQRLRSP